MSALREDELRAIADFAFQKWGLVIDAKKRVIVENQLAALRRQHPDLGEVASLVDGLRSRPEPKLELALFDVLSTNHTHFFREPEHLTLLQREILEPAKHGKRNGLRIWSAGCSRGCEPYSLSILMHETFGEPARYDHRILATDLSTGALQAARAGLYSGIEIEGVDPIRLKRSFTRVTDGPKPSDRVDPKLARIVSFGLLNLLESWPMKGPFDAVFCRNVMIYFDAATRKKLAGRFLNLIRPGGLLVVGTSETLADFGLPIDPVIASAYRKRGAVA